MNVSHAEVIARESELLTPECRASSERLDTLLHNDFREHGASGRVWTRGETIEILPKAPVVSGVPVDFRPTDLADGIVLLTYRIEGDRPSLRSSVWVKDSGAWRLLFHQGTLADS